MFQCNDHEEINKFLCSFACTWVTIIDSLFYIIDSLSLDVSLEWNANLVVTTLTLYRPLAGYGLPPPRGNFVDHIFLKAQCLARILQYVSPLTMAALSCNSLLHTLPYKIFDN